MRRIWVGERDLVALTQDMDSNSARLIERILEVVGEYERGERQTPAQTLAALPGAVRMALEQQDEAASTRRWRRSPDERTQVLEQLAPLAEGPEEQPGSVDPDVLRAALPDAVRWALDESPEALTSALDALPADQRLAAQAAIGALQTRTLALLPPAAPRGDREQRRTGAGCRPGRTAYR